jgi:hypothetical protein
LGLDGCTDAAECHDSCLVQPAVCPGSAAQAGWVICQALQHSQQAGLWPLQQGHWWRLVRHACGKYHLYQQFAASEDIRADALTTKYQAGHSSSSGISWCWSVVFT